VKISGFTCIRNAIELDYPVRLTIDSLLHGCDEVVVGVAASTDGTWEWLQEHYANQHYGRLVFVPQLWPDPNQNVRWWTQWINETRKRLSGDMQLFLDADEVIEPEAFETLRRAPASAVYTMHRLNYWRDTKHIIPHGFCCSHKVVRFAPANLWMTSDEIYRSQDFPEAEPEIRTRAVERMNLRIHHLGFLRKREALFKKVEVCLRAFFGAGQDARLIEAMKHPETHWTTFCPFARPLLRSQWQVPEVAREWCRERGAL
jgi:glycosyltransferase involved in cell wall biosynthesis